MSTEDIKNMRPKKRETSKKVPAQVSFKDKISKTAKEYKAVYKRIHWPSLNDWKKEYWKVLLGIIVMGILFTGVDWLFLEGISLLQAWIAGPGLEGIGNGIYTTLMIVSGTLLALVIFLQRGTTDGLTSMFGSGFEFGGSSVAGLTSRVSAATIILASIFAFLCLMSPLVLR